MISVYSEDLHFELVKFELILKSVAASFPSAYLKYVWEVNLKQQTLSFNPSLKFKFLSTTCVPAQKLG